MFLAVDPGGTIGYVLCSELPEPDLLAVERWGEVPKGKHQAFLDKVYDEVALGEITSIVVEAFRPTAGIKTWQPEALYQIGVLKFIAGRYGIPCAVQGVTDARTFATPAKEAPFTFVGKGGKGHARMALKHAIRWRWITYYGQHGQHNPADPDADLGDS